MIGERDRERQREREGERERERERERENEQRESHMPRMYDFISEVILSLLPYSIF